MKLSHMNRYDFGWFTRRIQSFTLVDLRGRQDPRPRLAPISSIFMQFSRNNRLVPSVWEILDPPLVQVHKVYSQAILFGFSNITQKAEEQISLQIAVVGRTWRKGQSDISAFVIDNVSYLTDKSSFSFGAFI